MDTELLRTAHTLSKGSLFRIHEGRGLRVECVSGCLWLTQARDPRDVVLESGQGFTIERGGDTYLSALDESRFIVLHGTAATAPIDAARAHKAMPY